MLSQRQAGFTLIEIILVTAIAGLLAMMVFAGQRSLRSRAMFDASVNKIVASIGDARNESLAGINADVSSPDDQGGTGLKNCPGGGETTFAGALWTGPTASASIREQFYRTDGRDNKTCTTIDGPKILSFQGPVNIIAGGSVVFARTSTGGLAVCRYAGGVGAAARDETFASGNCSSNGSAPITFSNPLTMTFKDNDNHTATVEVDSSGLARRHE